MYVCEADFWWWHLLAVMELFFFGWPSCLGNSVPTLPMRLERCEVIRSLPKERAKAGGWVRKRGKKSEEGDDMMGAGPEKRIVKCFSLSLFPLLLIYSQWLQTCQPLYSSHTDTHLLSHSFTQSTCSFASRHLAKHTTRLLIRKHPQAANRSSIELFGLIWLQDCIKLIC